MHTWQETPPATNLAKKITAKIETGQRLYQVVSVGHALSEARNLAENQFQMSRFRTRGHVSVVQISSSHNARMVLIASTAVVLLTHGRHFAVNVHHLSCPFCFPFRETPDFQFDIVGKKNMTINRTNPEYIKMWTT